MNSSPAVGEPGGTMQFGVFSVSDITRDPVSGVTPSEAERIDAIVEIATKAEEVGLDVFAIGEHHNPPFFSSSPTTTLAQDRKSTRLNSSHVRTAYAVFCLKKKTERAVRRSCDLTPHIV